MKSDSIERSEVNDVFTDSLHYLVEYITSQQSDQRFIEFSGLDGKTWYGISLGTRSIHTDLVEAAYNELNIISEKEYERIIYDVNDGEYYGSYYYTRQKPEEFMKNKYAFTNEFFCIYQYKDFCILGKGETIFRSIVNAFGTPIAYYRKDEHMWNLPFKKRKLK